VRRGYYQPSNTDALVMRKDLAATGTSSTGTGRGSGASA
jgi:hypothetical protein